MKVEGFEWDEGNWPKCGKHGVSRAEIEQTIIDHRFIVDDPHPTEPRFRTVGVTEEGRHVFCVFTIRQIRRKAVIRPISARFMHDKEVKDYEENKPDRP